MKRPLITDPTTGKTVYLQSDTDGDHIVTEQRFDTLLKINKQMSDDWNYGQMRGTQKHMAHIAEIPNVLYHHLLKTLGKPSENPKAWKQWLNDSENRAFRTGGGNV